MKILFVNNFRKRGGGEEFLRDLLPGLAAKGVEVGLVCRPHTPLAGMFPGSGVTVYPIDRSGIRGISSVLRTARVIRERKYEIVNIQRGHDIVQAWLGTLLSGTRPVLLYTPQVPEFIRSRFLLRRMDAVVTISRYIRDRLIAFDRTLAPRISIVHYGIDTARFVPVEAHAGMLRARFGLPGDARIIGTVGDLWKNQVEFLEVLALLRPRFPGLRYAIVGVPKENYLLRQFRSRAEALGVQDAVLWPGRLEKDAMRSFYADIDIAVSTYRHEGFGIWILEAMAMGLPVVAYDAGGIRDSLEGAVAGRLVAGGPQEMADALAAILADPAVCRTMAAAAPGWVRERFHVNRMIDDYDRYFRSLEPEHRRAGA